MLNDLKSDETVLGRPEGLPITRVLARLISSFPAIEEVSFVRFRPAPGLDERLSKSSDPAVEIRETAENLWRTYGIPFWDAILAISMKRGEIPDHYVDLAILHDPAPDELTLAVAARQLTEESIQLMVDELEDNTALAFSSKVVLRDGRIAHIPLMDFRCPPSASNSKILKRALKAIG